VTRSATNANVSTQRAIVANTILAAASVVLMLLLILLSSAILPSWKLLVAQALIVIATAILLRRSFTKLYSKAQVALQETLAQPPAAQREPPEHALPGILREAHLRTVRIPKQAGSAGKMIGELALRTRTGASIVGIQRDKESLVNPGADEELRAGDEILLLGSDDHLESAEKLLCAETQQP
jgi:CPA2 family monovalent cation:H+ antiporter-2